MTDNIQPFVASTRRKRSFEEDLRSHAQDGSIRRVRSLGELPRGSAKQIQFMILSEKIREMQFEVSRLSRKVKEILEESELWSLRYSRRMVVLSNVMLGGWIFLLRFSRCFKEGSEVGNRGGWLVRWLLPSASDKIPLSAVLVSAFLEGFQGATIFLISALLHLRQSSWKRNVAFGLSTSYSIYLAYSSDLNPRASNYFNVFFNVLFLLCRYYYLHGLLVFNNMRIL